MARYKQALNDLKELNCAPKAGGDLDTCPVLTESELVTLLQEEPYILLNFASDLPNPRIETKWASFETAMRFRMQLRCVQAEALDKLEALREKMSTEATAEKIERRSSRCQA